MSVSEPENKAKNVYTSEFHTVTAMGKVEMQETNKKREAKQHEQNEKK